MAERYFEIHYNNLSTINKKPPNNARSGQVVRAVIYKHFLASSLYCFQAESTSRPQSANPNRWAVTESRTILKGNNR